MYYCVVIHEKGKPGYVTYVNDYTFDPINQKLICSTGNDSNRKATVINLADINCISVDIYDVANMENGPIDSFFGGGS